MYVCVADDLVPEKPCLHEKSVRGPKNIMQYDVIPMSVKSYNERRTSPTSRLLKYTTHSPANQNHPPFPLSSLSSHPFHRSNLHRRRIPPHKNPIQPSTQRLPHRPFTHPPIPIRRLLQILQDQRPPRAKSFHEGEDSRVFVDDGLGDGGGDADDFLEHARVG